MRCATDAPVRLLRVLRRSTPTVSSVVATSATTAAAVAAAAQSAVAQSAEGERDRLLEWAPGETIGSIPARRFRD